MSDSEQTVVTEPWQFQATIYFVSAVQVAMAIYEISLGTEFTWAVGVVLLASTVGLIRRLRWGHAMSVVMMWLLLVVAVGSILPARIEGDEALGVESPTVATLVTQLIVMCSVALGSLHFLSKYKDRFRSGRL